MSGPLPIALIVGGYLLFVLDLGPRLMANREPYKLHNVMIGYNVFVAIASAAIFYGVRIIIKKLQDFLYQNV